MAQAGLFIAVHGAGVINAVLMPPGGVVVEIYPFAPLGCHFRPAILRAGAAHYVPWCGALGDCSAPPSGDGATCELYSIAGPYPHAQVTIDVARLRNRLAPLIGGAVHT